MALKVSWDMFVLPVLRGVCAVHLRCATQTVSDGRGRAVFVHALHFIRLRLRIGHLLGTKNFGIEIEWFIVCLHFARLSWTL